MRIKFAALKEGLTFKLFSIFVSFGYLYLFFFLVCLGSTRKFCTHFKVRKYFLFIFIFLILFL